MDFIARIGQGGFGNVDLIFDHELGYECARKQFSQNQALTPELLRNVKKRFSKEVKVQSAISHPNIVPVLRSDLAHEPPYYLMPLASSTLDKEILKDRTLDGSFVSAISDIVAALEEMHSMEIYHRDLKPQNVLQFQRNGSPVYAVSDFGLISMKESTLSELTHTGMGKGSDYYTAPEIHADLRRASPRSDVYSLGCILHDMIGIEPRIPFNEIKEAGSFSAVLAGCTKANPSKRFPSAKSVLDAILTIEFEPEGTISEASEDYLTALVSDDVLSQDFCARFADYLEFNAEKADINAIFGKLTVGKINNIWEVDALLANRIGLVFAEWVKSTSFNFDFCDAIANRVEAFYQNADLELKVDCLMAFLVMGTSHNRWYVERKFARMCALDMDDNVAKRLIIKFHIEGIDLVRSCIAHLESSIGISRSQLHTKIQSAL
ncbi:serine/threonine-protein kinase [Cobetia marina]|uniref:Serine/threonine-protein kinase n=1 Tax=Cobetia marina TaxID=28258 RepID=A0ABU9GAZ0_COBMA